MTGKQQPIHPVQRTVRVSPTVTMTIFVRVRGNIPQHLPENAVYCRDGSLKQLQG